MKLICGNCKYHGSVWNYTATASVVGKMRMNSDGTEDTPVKKYEEIMDSWDTEYFCPVCEHKYEGNPH